MQDGTELSGLTPQSPGLPGTPEAGSKLGHSDQGTRPSLTWPHVLQCEVLIGKAASVDGLPSCAVVVGEVASL